MQGAGLGLSELSSLAFRQAAQTFSAASPHNAAPIGPVLSARMTSAALPSELLRLRALSLEKTLAVGNPRTRLQLPGDDTCHHQ